MKKYNVNVKAYFTNQCYMDGSPILSCELNVQTNSLKYLNKKISDFCKPYSNQRYEYFLNGVMVDICELYY